MKPIFIYNSKIPIYLSLFINIYGITIYPFIIFRDDKSQIPHKTINHELIHIRQQEELFVVFFYILYVMYWVINLFKFKDYSIAYKLIPFEREAYANEYKDYYFEERPMFAWTKYRKLKKG